MVTTQDGHKYKAKVIGHDDKTDIALLKIEARHDLPVAPLGNSDDVKVGEWVMAIGNPFGFDHSVTAGIVSAKGRFIPGNYDDFIQTDASINPGNSGGPLIDLRGEVIGVNSAIYTRTGSSMGIGFAVPINLVKEELPQLTQLGQGRARMARRLHPEGDAGARRIAGTGGAARRAGRRGAGRRPGEGGGRQARRRDRAFDNRQSIDDSRELPLMVGAHAARPQARRSR